MDHEYSGKLADVIDSVNHTEDHRHDQPLFMDDIYIVIPEYRSGLYHFVVDLDSEFSFKQYAIEFGFFIEEGKAFDAYASMIITALVLFSCSIFVTISKKYQLKARVNYP